MAKAQVALKETSAQVGDRSSKAAAVAPTLRQFTLDFFGFFGATVSKENRRANGPVHVVLGDELSEHFGAATMRLCFEHADASPDVELMARGSRQYDLMMAYLKGRSAATLLELPRRHTSSEELMRAVRLLNASIVNLQMRETHQRFYVFNWRLTFRSDEKYEELYSVLLNDEGERVLVEGSPGAREDAPSLDAFFADGEAALEATGEGDVSDDAKMPPMTQLVRLAESARKYAVYHADTQSAAHEAEILPRLYRTLNRITTYYGQQIDEVYDSHDADGEKRVALHQDMERKIAEEVENHRLRVSVRLFSYAVFQAPVAVAEMTLSDGVREAQVQVTRDRYSGAIGRPHCHACGQEAAEVALDRNGHVTCDGCIEQCATCNQIVCRACGVEPCPVCGMQNCADCGHACWACGGRACPEHSDVCPVCGDQVCHACMDVCAHCGTRQCRSHLLADAVVADDGAYDWICDACAVRCPGCRQFSARIATCQASGQQFCENCLTVCAECGSTVGPGFYERSVVDGRAYCVNCLRECSGCGRSTPDMEKCEKCGAEYCPNCGLLCDICGGHCCDGQYERFARCGHVVCVDHDVHCSTGGELICAVCSQMCGICGLPFCEIHSLRCRHCGQQYCGNCIGISGMCATCESLAHGDAEPVDMAQEPCLADLEVAAMVRHYKWQRAGNARYVIYEGSHHFTGGVVVVVDSSRGAANVVEVRRIGLLEMVRNRLFGSDAD